jgi:hypothetical protein
MLLPQVMAVSLLEGCKTLATGAEEGWMDGKAAVVEVAAGRVSKDAAEVAGAAGGRIGTEVARWECALLRA